MAHESAATSAAHVEAACFQAPHTTLFVYSMLAATLTEDQPTGNGTVGLADYAPYDGSGNTDCDADRERGAADGDRGCMPSAVLWAILTTLLLCLVAGHLLGGTTSASMLLLLDKPLWRLGLLVLAPLCQWGRLKVPAYCLERQGGEDAREGGASSAASTWPLPKKYTRSSRIGPREFRRRMSRPRREGRGRRRGCRDCFRSGKRCKGLRHGRRRNARSIISREYGRRHGSGRVRGPIKGGALNSGGEKVSVYQG